MELKAGVTTSEFWTAVLSLAAGVAPAILAATHGNAVVAAITGAISLVGPAVYIWGRSILKAEQARQTDLIPDGWQQKISDVLDVVEKVTQVVQAANQAASASAAATQAATPAGAREGA